MAIEIPEENHAPTTPIVKRTAIGETFMGAIVRVEQRDVKKRYGSIDRKPDGNPRQELIVHCIALPNSTAPVGKGEVQRATVPGEECRLLLRGGGFGQWIEARQKHRDGGSLVVGDLIATQVTYGQAYNADGKAEGGQITDQASIVALKMRGKTVGLYGPLQLAEARADEWTVKAEQSYMKATAIELDVATLLPPTGASTAAPVPTSAPSPAATSLFGNLLD